MRHKYAKHLLVVAFFLVTSIIIFRNYFNGPYIVGTDAMGDPSQLVMMKVDSLFFSAWRAWTSLRSP